MHVRRWMIVGIHSDAIALLAREHGRHRGDIRQNLN
jgi:hypothetical protein